MNNSLTRSLLRLLAFWPALLLATNALAQGNAPSLRAADFIVAVVNSEPVTNSEVGAMRKRLLSELLARGEPIPETAQLNQQALDWLINEKAQLQLAQETGVRIDAEQLAQTEANIAARNQLTPEAFAQRLVQEGSNLAEFRQQLKNQLTLAKLREREVDRQRISEQDIDAFLQARQTDTRSVQTALNLGMILVALPENASEAEVRAAQAKAQDIARRARQGEDFANLAKTFSEANDKGANGGVMGLRSSERYPELFVEATRTLLPQQVSEPVRSGAGFHVLKVLERQQSTQMTVVQTRARHILLRSNAQRTRDQAVAQLLQVRRDILGGQIAFARAAQTLSEDGSAAQGGDLGWVGPGQFVPEFEQVMNGLRPGQVSEPLVSRFGVHLIEVMDRRQVAVPEKEQREMARNALREQRTEEALERWAEDVRGRAYVELREPVQLPAPSAR